MTIETSRKTNLMLTRVILGVLVAIMLLFLVSCKNIDDDLKPQTATIVDKKTDDKDCEHKWSEWEKTSEATCSQDGVLIRKCEKCLSEEKEVIEKLKHTEGDWVIDEIAKVGKAGKKHTECIYCKKQMKTEKIPAIDKNHTHNGVEWIVTKQSTCTEEGSKDYICSCGTVIKTDKVKMKEHNLKTRVVEPTTYEEGYTLHYCIECSYTFKDNFVASKYIHIQNVEFSKTEYEMKKGDTYKLQLNISPSNATNKNVAWSSSDTSVATIQDGKVVAVGNGVTSIKAVTEDMGFEAACFITVKTAVTGIKIEKKQYDLYRNSSTNITATIIPGDASNKGLSWTSSDANIVSVSNGKIYGKSNGTATITVSTVDGGYTEKITVNVTNAPLTMKCDIRYCYGYASTNYRDYLEGSATVSGGSPNYSNYSYDLAIYWNDTVIASESNVTGIPFNSGGRASIKGFFQHYIEGEDKVQQDVTGTYKVVVTVKDDEGNECTGQASMYWDDPYF